MIKCELTGLGKELGENNNHCRNYAKKVCQVAEKLVKQSERHDGGKIRESGPK